MSDMSKIPPAVNTFERHVHARYTYLGDRLTDPALLGMQCDPVRREDGKCIVSIKMAVAIVEDAQGTRYIVLRRRLRLNKQKGEGNNV
jgi:hypothetical protein